METFRQIALREGWLWVGTDLSESASVSETNISIRLLTDLSLVTSSIVIEVGDQLGFQFERTKARQALNFSLLTQLYEEIPGLIADKLKGTLEYIWDHMPTSGRGGLIFAYDEAQNLSDNARKEEFPLSLLLDVFQSIQRKGIPFMLVLTGLPTLFPKLVDARTYTERMFHTIFLDKLNDADSREAIIRPIQDAGCPVMFNEESVKTISKISGGYPFFIQFICKEVYDVWVQKASFDEELPTVPVDEIMRKLDSDFFAGRWTRVTDRQRELLWTYPGFVES